MNALLSIIPIPPGKPSTSFLCGVGITILILFYFSIVNLLPFLAYSVTCHKAQAHLFYHIMLTPDKHRNNEVINEQIGYIRESGMEDMLSEVHYTVVGDSWNKFKLESGNDKYKKTNASNNKGWEPDTLHLLHDHCLQHPKDVVLYLHTKGLFHQTPENEIQRKDQTRSLSSFACLQSMRGAHEKSGIWETINASGAPLSGLRGNACGMRFSPSPHFHFPGNMFWARCDYVQNLMDPIPFEPKMTMMQEYVYPGAWFKKTPSALGIERFSAEHWIGSHPSLRAVDLMPGNAGKDGSFFNAGYAELPETAHSWDPTPSLIPRSDVNPEEYVKTGFFQIMLQHGVYVDTRIKEYTDLYGSHALDQEWDNGCVNTPCRLYSTIAAMMQHAVTVGKTDIYGKGMETHFRRWILGWETGYPPLHCSRSCSKL